MMSTERELAFTEEDIANPLPYLERLSEGGLREWLRLAFWTRKTSPLIVPRISRNAIEISRLLKQGSSDLKTRVRKVIPELLQEWGRDDPIDTLDDLLIVCGRLRCAGAAVDIALIISERLDDRPAAIGVRQRGLSVLSGFGCTDRTVHIFERYLSDIEYAAISYRALYRYDFNYAATALPGVIKLFENAGATDEFHLVVSSLAKDLRSLNEVMKLHLRYLRIGAPDELVNVLEILREAGLLTTTLMLEAGSDQRKQFSSLLLERCSPATISKLLWTLKEIGTGLHKVQASNGEETMQLRVKEQSTGRKVAENIIATRKMRPKVLAAIVDANEPLAFSAYASSYKTPTSH